MVRRSESAQRQRWPTAHMSRGEATDVCDRLAVVLQRFLVLFGCEKLVAFFLGGRGHRLQIQRHRSAWLCCRHLQTDLHAHMQFEK